MLTRDTWEWYASSRLTLWKKANELSTYSFRTVSVMPQNGYKKLFKVSLAEITCRIHEQAKCFHFCFKICFFYSVFFSFFLCDIMPLWHVFMLCQINVSFQFRPPWWALNQWMCVSKISKQRHNPFSGGKEVNKTLSWKKKDLTLWFNIELSFIVQLVRHLIKEAMACLHWRY